MKLGIELLREDKTLQEKLKNKRVSILCNQSSVASDLTHTLDVCFKELKLNVVSVFAPQHGFFQNEQDDMKESAHCRHQKYDIPIYSLYSSQREPDKKMVQEADIFLVDLFDVGCRIYTYQSTMLYLMRECAKQSKQLWVLDRPNPVGRHVAGPLLEKGYESIVGVREDFIVQPGMSIGEIAKYFKDIEGLDLDLEVVAFRDAPKDLLQEGRWPDSLVWVNPSPNVPRHSTTLCFPGTVLLEGTLLSEGRGTTRPLELWGAPWIRDVEEIMKKIESFIPSTWSQGYKLRECSFQPTFQKHANKPCQGFQWHVEKPFRKGPLKMYRSVMALLKVLTELYPDQKLFKDPPYEYVKDKLPFDVISGHSKSREWIEDKSSTAQDLEQMLAPQEATWTDLRQKYLLY